MDVGLRYGVVLRGRRAAVRPSRLERICANTPDWLPSTTQCEPRLRHAAWEKKA